MMGPSIFQHLRQIMQMVNQIRQNPALSSQYLYESGIISQQQYTEMQKSGISGNPEAVGQYLMNHGVVDPSRAQQMVNQYAMPINNSMKQN